mgnify:CR=1 FL=1
MLFRSYWRTTTGVEVDFIVGEMRLAIEVKSTRSVSDHHLHGLRTLQKSYPNVRRVLIYLGDEPSRTDDGIDILPVHAFLTALWGDAILKGVKRGKGSRGCNGAYG